MLHDVVRFLDIYLMRPHKIVGLLPEVRPELPVVTLRESLVNALAHRDYTISAPVRAIVFDDLRYVHRASFRTRSRSSL